jgi:hypothetical protein
MDGMGVQAGRYGQEGQMGAGAGWKQAESRGQLILT